MCVSVYICACVRGCVSVCIYNSFVCVCVCKGACMSACICVCMCFVCVCVCAHAHECIVMSLCVCVCAQLCMPVCSGGTVMGYDMCFLVTRARLKLDTS